MPRRSGWLPLPLYPGAVLDPKPPLDGIRFYLLQNRIVEHRFSCVAVWEKYSCMPSSSLRLLGTPKSWNHEPLDYRGTVQTKKPNWACSYGNIRDITVYNKDIYNSIVRKACYCSIEIESGIKAWKTWLRSEGKLHHIQHNLLLILSK